MEGMAAKSWLRLGIVITVLLLLSTGAWIGYTGWSQRVALEWLERRFLAWGMAGSSRAPVCLAALPSSSVFEGCSDGCEQRYLMNLLESGRQKGWVFKDEGRWIPRRAIFDYLELMTGETLPYEYDAWEAWLRARPGLILCVSKQRVEDNP